MNDKDLIKITDDTPENKIRSSYIICTLPRSGSNLMMFTFRKQGLGHPHEYFNQNRVDVFHYVVHHTDSLDLTDWTPGFLNKSATLSEYTQALTQNRCSSNGVFGSKLFANDVNYSQENWMVLKKALPEDTKYIYLQRKDLIAQSISMYFAAVTNVWFEKKETSEETLVEYSFEKILPFFEDLKKGYVFWEKMFSQPSPNAMIVRYADLAQNYKETIRSVNTFMGHHDLEIPPQSIRKQVNSLKEAYSQRFKRDLIRHMKSQSSR